MKGLLIPLMEEYKRLIEIEEKYLEWKRENPESYSWNYNGQRVSRSRFERIGIMIRQSMVDFEKEAKK